MAVRQALRRVFAGAVVALVTVALLGSAACASGPGATGASTAPTTQDPWRMYGLSVKGTQIVTPSGQPITLLGAARFSLEFECKGDGHFQLSDFQAMRAWGMNTVRIPLSSAFWRNLDNGCPTYRATVVSAVAQAEAAGLYVILDLQRDAPFSLAEDATSGGTQCPLPDATSDVAFWQDLAALYRDDPHVMFDLFGEPHDVTWNQWWQGGAITTSCHHYQTRRTYTAVSMPALAAAVRAVAPRNLIILSGLDWGYDLSGVSSQHAVQLTNVLYGTHPWNHYTVQQPSDWARAFGATARQLPVIATEFGAYNCQTDYISTELTYFTGLHMSFLGWAWARGDCKTPALISSWSGAPTTPYGSFIRQRMLAVAATNPPLPTPQT